MGRSQTGGSDQISQTVRDVTESLETYQFKGSAKRMELHVMFTDNYIGCKGQRRF